jgi:hypothetical protein
MKLAWRKARLSADVSQQPARKRFVVDTSRLPRPARDDLSPSATRMLLTFRNDAPLIETAVQFPHVLNRLARAMADPPLMVRLIDSLVIDDRHDREGFPFPVLAELTRLREVFQIEAERR